MLIYLAGVLAGSLTTSIIDPTAILVGASGGVYALSAAHVASIIMVSNHITDLIVRIGQRFEWQPRRFLLH